MLNDRDLADTCRHIKNSRKPGQLCFSQYCKSIKNTSTVLLDGHVHFVTQLVHTVHQNFSEVSLACETVQPRPTQYKHNPISKQIAMFSDELQNGPSEILFTFPILNPYSSYAITIIRISGAMYSICFGFTGFTREFLYSKEDQHIPGQDYHCCPG